MDKVNRREFGLFGAGALATALIAKTAHAQAADAEQLLSHVDPELRPAAINQIRQGAGQWTLQGLQAMRQGGGPPTAPWLSDIPVQEVKVPVGKGQPDVTLFVINARAGASRPAILHTHGGGHILGSARSEVAYEQALAKALDCVIVTVEYRLGPETTYRGSIEDNYAGLRWLHAEADRLGVDRKRIVAMGESAGGTHAALLALTARDRREIPLAAQILIYPMLDDRTGSTRKVPPFIGAFGWTAAANRFGWQCFLGLVPGGSNVLSGGVPARRADLAGLPPAYVAVGGIDLFVSEDIEYARRLTEAGVPTELLVLPGAFHGFDRVAPDTRIAQAFTAAKLAALRKAFA